MATSVATPAPAALSVKTENVVYTRFVKASEAANGQKVYQAKVIRNANADDQAQMEKEGYQFQAAQSVTIYSAGTPDGFEQIIKDEEERTNVFNRGLAQKTQNKLNSLLQETNEDGSPVFPFSEDAYDSLEKLNELTNRRNLSPTDKARKLLEASGLDQATIAAMLSAMVAQAQ
jgi:hypothetical protein